MSIKIYCIFQDLNELELPKTCKTEFPDVDDLLNFKLIIYPDEVFLYTHGAHCTVSLHMVPSNKAI